MRSERWPTPRLPLQLLLETARGLMAAGPRGHPSVAGIALGEADLAADQVWPDWSGLGTVGGRPVARAAGLPSPVQSVHRRRRPRWPPATTAAAGTRSSSAAPSSTPADRARPRGVPADRGRARPTEVVNAYDRARERGEAAALTPDGRFVDPAVVAGAQSPSGSLPSTDRARAPPPRKHHRAPRRTDDHRGAAPGHNASTDRRRPRHRSSWVIRTSRACRAPPTIRASG